MSRSPRHTRKIVAASIALILLVGTPSGATTGGTDSPGGGGRGTIGQEGETGVVTITASTTHVPVGGSGETSCTEQSETAVYISDDFVTPLTAGFYLTDPVPLSGPEPQQSPVIIDFIFSSGAGHPLPTRLFSPTGRWFRYNCGSTYYLLPEGGPAITIDGLVENAVNSLDPPQPTLAITPHHGKHAVQMPSWLAIEPEYWDQPRTATATAGRVEVTATLTPTQIHWDMGNGDTVNCDNPGIIWRSYMSESTSTCGYTYTWPSINPPHHTYELAGTVSFDVNHTTNAPGTYGPWTPVERTTTETIQVVEIQSVSTPNPAGVSG